jgi:ketosteroid isomerase-like protein
LARIIRTGIDSGEFSCPDPNASAMRLTALVDGLAVQFAAHDGMMNRDQLIDHVRFAAAAEIGITMADFTGATPAPHAAPPSPATDASLRHLVSSYCDHVNRADGAALARSWAEDATWNPAGDDIVGRKNILAAFDKMRAAFDWIVQSAPLMVFEVDESSGRGTGRVTVHERSRKHKSVKATSTLATYHDEYVRRAGSWMFAARTIEVIERV